MRGWLGALSLGTVCLLVTVGVARVPGPRPEHAREPGHGAPLAPIPAPLDGVWTLVSRSSTLRGEQLPPNGWEMTKFVSAGRFAWFITRDGVIRMGSGGTCSVEGDRYTERVSFVSDPKLKWMLDQTFTFTWSIEGGRWHHIGVFRMGEKMAQVDEVWERARFEGGHCRKLLAP